MINVGVVGCGNISSIYFKNIVESDKMQLIGIFDIDNEKMQNVKEEYPFVICFNSLEELLESSEIDTVLNLTVPKLHFEINKLILNANKNLYCEKPLTLKFEDATILKTMAMEKGLKLAAAPDTFLGQGFQEQKTLVDNGEYGKCIGGLVVMGCPGHEGWHPNPEFYYENGGGPLFDMGPYYISNLIELFGPVKSVSAHSTMSSKKREYVNSVTKEEKVINVETPTHINGFMNFANDVSVNFIFSFDMFGEHQLPNFQLFFEKGIYNLNDPNTFSTESYIYIDGEKQILDSNADRKENGRGLGIIYSNENKNYCTDKAVHIVEVMEKIMNASLENKYLEITSTIEK